MEKLPFLGRTWYRRGWAYWFRRALWSLCTLLILVLFSLITGGLVAGIATDTIPLWVRVVILAVIAAAILRSMVIAWTAFNTVNRARRHGTAMSLAQASGETPARRRPRVLVTGALLVISVVFNFGWGIVLFVASFQRYFSPAELRAWQRLEKS